MAQLAPHDAIAGARRGPPDAAVGVATVNSATGEVGSSARLPGHGPHLEIDAARARALAGADPDARTELVWHPSVSSKSALYPLWEVELPHGNAYVDQTGALASHAP